MTHVFHHIQPRLIRAVARIEHCNFLSTCNAFKNVAPPVISFSRKLRISATCKASILADELPQQYRSTFSFRDTDLLKFKSYSPGCISGMKLFHSSSYLLNTQEKQSNSNDFKKQTDDIHSDSVKEMKDGADETGKDSSAKLTLAQRFKQSYKQYGKVLVVVHATTIVMWIGSFYCLVSWGVDVVGILQSWGVSETILSPFKKSGLGTLAVAYLLYKLISPIRYIVTIVATQVVVKLLRSRGLMKPVAPEDKVKELLKERTHDMKIKMDEKKDEFLTKVADKTRFTGHRKGEHKYHDN